MMLPKRIARLDELLAARGAYLNNQTNPKEVVIMATETPSVDLEDRKDEIVDPVAIRFGKGQNFRCTPSGDGWVSRPQKSSDKWYDPYIKFIRKPKEEGGLGLGKDAKAVHFSHRAGVRARIRFITMVNEGKAVKPKNWDKKFTEERTVSFNGIDDKEPRTLTLPAGLSGDELEKKYPELYETKSSRRSGEGRDQAEMLEEDSLETLLEEEPSEVEMRTTLSEELTEQETEGETMMSLGEDEEEEVGAEETDEVYAVTGTAVEDEVDEEDLDNLLEDSTEPGESASQAASQGRISGAAAARHEKKEETGSGRIEEFDQPREKEVRRITAKLPSTMSPQVVKGPWIRVMDESGDEHDFYRIKHPVTKDIIWIQEGTTNYDGCEIHLTIKE